MFLGTGTLVVCLKLLWDRGCAQKHAQNKLPVTQAQKLGYAYNWKIYIENTHVSKTVKIMSVSITELIWQAKP